MKWAGQLKEGGWCLADRQRQTAGHTERHEHSFTSRQDTDKVKDKQWHRKAYSNTGKQVYTCPHDAKFSLLTTW